MYSNSHMKKALWILSLCIYLFFSQFAIKAVATTDLITSGDDTFCMTKKLDTIDGKQDCREKNNAAIFSQTFEISDFLLEQWYTTLPSIYSLYTESKYIPDIVYHSHAPPDERWVLFSKYVHNYVGITLILF